MHRRTGSYDHLGEHGKQQLDLHTDAALLRKDTAPHATFLQAVRLCLQAPDYCNATETSSPPTGTDKPQCTGVISFQSGMGCECQWKQAPEGDTGDVPMGKSQGCGWGSHKPGGYTVWLCIHSVRFATGLVILSHSQPPAIDAAYSSYSHFRRHATPNYNLLMQLQRGRP